MPYAFAPEAQTHVGAVVWLSDNFDEISFDKLKAAEQQPFSQDNLFHTVLGMMEIETKVYDANKDIFKLTNK
jgi:lipid A ethanolaminephosphotransferase